MRTPVRNSGLTRGDLVFDALGNIGRGLSTTGSLSTGIALASEGQKELFKDDRRRQGDEEERQYRRLEMAYKQKKLEQEAAPQTHVIPAGGILAGPTGEVLAQAPRAEKVPTSIEAALFSDNPEIRARAEELRDRAAEIKGTPTPLQRQQLELSRKRLEVEIAKANRPPGQGAAPAPSTLGKLFQERAALPPGDPRIAQYDRMIETETLRGRTGVDATTREPGYLAPPQTAQNKAAEAVSTVDELNERIAGIEAMDADLPDLMTSPAQGMASLTAAAERWGVPVSTAQTQYLEKQRTLATQLEDLTSTIRLARAGQTLTGPELASAEKYLPTGGDSVTTLRTKLKKLKEIAATARRRNVDVLDPKKGIRREPEVAAVRPPGRTAPADAAGTVQLGAPKPGTTFTDDEGNVWHLKGGDPNDKANWELAQ
jgi:hypothetical protein